jgi:hypothetical protein
MPAGIYFAIGAIIIVVVIVLVLLLGRRGAGRLIECPECGNKFPRPAFTEKTVGFGPSLPGMGNYTCPKCKYRASVSYFKYVDENESSPSGK